MIGTVQIKSYEINSQENCRFIFASSKQRMIHILSDLGILPKILLSGNRLFGISWILKNPVDEIA
jgi:hypothetical protein